MQYWLILIFFVFFQDDLELTSQSFEYNTQSECEAAAAQWTGGFHHVGAEDEIRLEHYMVEKADQVFDQTNVVAFCKAQGTPAP